MLPAEMIAIVAPVVQCQFALDGDWQPFEVSASAAVETAHGAWLNGLSPITDVQSGKYKYSIDFTAMQQTNGQSGTCRQVHRQEYFTPDEVNVLRVELERLRAECDALVRERDEISARLESLESQVLVPRRNVWRSLEALADRLFAVPTHSLSPGVR